MGKHIKYKMFYKITYQYRHAKALSNFKEKKKRYLSMEKDEFLMNYIEINASYERKKWMIFIFSFIWLMIMIFFLLYVKKIFTVLPIISNYEYLSTFMIISICLPCLIILLGLGCLVNSFIKQNKLIKEKLIMAEVKRYLQDASVNH